jgi:pimeloyl-ACP methyl ester carboxylesterase
LQDALAHFRLAPTQACENPYILDYIARQALKPAPLPDGSGGEGWTWRFDPFLFAKIPAGFQDQVTAALPAARCPLALIWGDRSALMAGPVLDYTLTHAPEGTPKILMPDAAHHLFLDQPVATVASLRSVFAAWPDAAV